MVLVDVDSRPRLALNEACEQKHVLSDLILQPISALEIVLAVAYAFNCCVRIGYYAFFCKDSSTSSSSAASNRSSTPHAASLCFHACLAQLLYHATHCGIHVGVDMAHEEWQRAMNPVLAFHFAHQAGTLGAFYASSWAPDTLRDALHPLRSGLLLPFALVAGAFASTGMIYPTIWTYLPLVALYRSKLGKAAVIGSFVTLVLTGLEVRLCDVAAVRSGTGYSLAAFPWHTLGDAGQMVSVFIQSHGLLEIARAAAREGHPSEAKKRM